MIDINSRHEVHYKIFISVSTSSPSGLDETYVISRNNKYGIFTKHFAARVVHRKSGRFLEVYSNQPGLHFYSGNLRKIVGNNEYNNVNDNRF